MSADYLTEAELPIRCRECKGPVAESQRQAVMLMRRAKFCPQVVCEACDRKRHPHKYADADASKKSRRRK